MIEKKTGKSERKKKDKNEELRATKRRQNKSGERGSFFIFVIREMFKSRAGENVKEKITNKKKIEKNEKREK